MGHRLRSAARRIAALEPVVVVLAAPLLLFPAFQASWTAAALVALLGVWLCRWIGSRRPATPTALDLSLLALLLMVPVAVWASAFPELTLPKLTGLILGVAVFRATVGATSRPRGLALAVAAYLGLGLGLAAVGLLGTNWAGKLPGLQPVLGHIPQIVQGLPGAEGGINANELGGVLTLFLPVSLAAVGVSIQRRGWLRWTAPLAALLLTLFFCALLLLSQSRSAWIGAAAGLGAMAWLRWPRLGWLLLAVVLLLTTGLLVIGPQVVAWAVLEAGAPAGAETVVGTANLAGRVEIWNRAVYAIQDFAFTGSGLGAFRQVVHLLYPLFLVGPGTDIAHAHNVFLQVALDVGLPGLVAYLALVGTALWIGWRLARRPLLRQRRGIDQYRWLALGLAGALVAFHIYGLTDAIVLGAKPGIALWMLLALAARLDRGVRVKRRRSLGAPGGQAAPSGDDDLPASHRPVWQERPLPE